MVAADKNAKTKAAVPTITAHTSKLPAFNGAEGTRPRPMARRGSKAVRRAQDFGWKSRKPPPFWLLHLWCRLRVFTSPLMQK